MAVDTIRTQSARHPAPLDGAPTRLQERITTAWPVKTAKASEVERVVSVLVRAFRADPALRWCYPGAAQYRAHFPDFVRAFAGRAFEHGTAYGVNDYAGAALWLPPGVHPDDDALTALIERTVPPQDQEEVFAVFEQMAAYHPSEPHWYLALIGVEPALRGKGYGSALLEPVLSACDRDRIPAYLESSNPTNVPFYERHGFALLGTVQVGASPPIFPMVREPR